MNNLIKSNDNHNVLLRNAYLEDKQLCIENKKCWLSCIKSLQRLLNVNLDTECKMLGSRLEKFFEDNFFTELQLQQNNVQCGKLSFYSTLFNYDIKKLEIQPYLCLPLPKNLVSYLNKLRISAHQLYVETGRYCNLFIPRENRFCFYSKNFVEDEKHFLLDCPLYVIECPGPNIIHEGF